MAPKDLSLVHGSDDIRDAARFPSSEHWNRGYRMITVKDMGDNVRMPTVTIEIPGTGIVAVWPEETPPLLDVPREGEQATVSVEEILTEVPSSTAASF